MLRPECRPSGAEAFHALPPKLLVIGLGLAVAACSGDITRFDPPTFGLTTSSPRLSSAPIPPEGMLGNSGSQLSDSTPYDSGYRPAPRRTYASAPSSYGRQGSGYPPSHGGNHDANRRVATAEPGYGTDRAYQPAYQAPSAPTYQPPAASRRQSPPYPSQTRPEPQTRAAALPPSTARQPYRTLTSPSPARTTTAPARSAPRPAATRPSPSSNPRLVEVQPGDTLIGLADRHNVSISELMNINGLSSPVLRPGQKLLLPRGARVFVASDRQKAREPDDNRVAALSHPGPTVAPASVSAADEDEVNDEPSFLADTLEATEPAATSGTHTIQRGESLYGIAVRYGVSLAELQRINGISDPRKVRAGTVLKLPASSSSGPALAEKEPEPAERTVAEARSSEPVRPAVTIAPVDRTDEVPGKPVIINAPRKVAELDTGETRSDVSPITAAPPEVPAATERAPAAQSKASAEEQADGIGKFRWPVKGRVIAGFGKGPDGSHSDGIKLAVPAGTEVHAAESGVVAYAGDELKGYGNLVLIRHDDGWITAYAHNSELQVKRGDRVRRGQVIAKAGNTGNADRPQLHFELRKGSSPVDPIPHLEKL